MEFFRSGQEGWTDYYDPRYSVAFLDVGEVGHALQDQNLLRVDVSEQNLSLFV